MPNWCEQDLFVEGPTEMIEAFVEAVRGEEKRNDGEVEAIDHEKILPMPKELLEVSAGSADEYYRIWHGDWEKSPFMEGEATREQLQEKLRKRFPENDLDEIVATQKSNLEQFGAINWYDWARDNWGTKWGICRSYLEEKYDWEGKGEVLYTFESAWTPAIPIVVEMSRKWPKLDFVLKYFERGAEFNGRMEFKAGEIVSDEQGKYFGSRGG